ncbi:MAG TPA: phosphoribosylamine--glycine ligase [Candidatus Hydrogenedentes bacterium]|nr:phosphoribosylamine--glycine ligase [Candidatus Hydrogenedentota bacterium]
MKVLVVGGGGREHALVWKIAQSPLVSKLYCAPGNPGIATQAECVDIAASDVNALAAFAKENKIDLSVVGPEDPLSRGVVDVFNAQGLKAFGPSKAAAQLEASKAFAKHIMAKYNIPTSRYATFTDAESAINYVLAEGAPIVVKADGLAAGKGVTVAQTVDEAIAAIRAMMSDRIFGQAGAQIVIEECLIGEEASILAFCDGRTVIPMIPSQDHKAAYDGDTGPNTGGMGAYAPAPVVPASMLPEITRTVLQPCVDGMAAEGTPYCGILYAGLMITAEGPKVIEFNCRFGDPETQVVLPLLESDIVPILTACCDGTLDRAAIQWSGNTCVSVVMASGGYPGAFEKGLPITGIEKAEEHETVKVFHAGTKQSGGEVVTNGGRVLNVTAVGGDIRGAIVNAYGAVSHIRFENAHYRSDIGKKALRRLEANQ